MKAFELRREVDEQHCLRAQMRNDCATGEVRGIVLRPESDNGTNGATQNRQDVGAEDESSDLLSWLDGLAVDAGIEDLAHQHDHYIHGTPKRGEAASES